MDDLHELKERLETKLNKLYPSKIFLDKLRVIDEDSRTTSPYCDPRYVPFYYWLGTMTKPESLVEIGFRLGLFSACFLKACKTVKHFLGFQQATEDFYSSNLGKANVRDNYKKKQGPLNIYTGSIYDEEMERLLGEVKWDMAIINEELNYDSQRAILDICWEQMNMDGLIVMDYVNRHKPNQEAYEDFCKGKNREPVVVNTRYGVGLIRR